jgi:hypothetical protein
MKSNPLPIAAGAGLALALALAGAAPAARAQDAAPTLASLAAQVKALTEQLHAANALAARQQQAIEQLRVGTDTLKSKLVCVTKYSGAGDFVVDGCNLHVQNGVGQTGTTNGKGNLVVGYNKNEVATRTGSHNVIVGDLHEYTSYGGIVSGTENTLAAPNATILGGGQNSANTTGGGAIIGASQSSTDANVVLLGGLQNYGGPNAHFAVAVGGNQNQVTGGNAVVVAGTLNVASGGAALACGGSENTAGGGNAVACGGSGNHSTGGASIVLGGNQNAAGGSNGVVTGGQHCDIGAVSNKWAAGLQGSAGCSAFAN